MRVNFSSNTITFRMNSGESFVNINLNHRILAFCINEKYVAVIEDWHYLDCPENLHIYDLNGNFIFDVKPAPKRLFENGGYYNSIGFENENTLIAISADYRYKIDLTTQEVITQEFTK